MLQKRISGSELDRYFRRQRVWRLVADLCVAATIPLIVGGCLVSDYWPDGFEFAAKVVHDSDWVSAVAHGRADCVQFPELCGPTH